MSLERTWVYMGLYEVFFTAMRWVHAVATIAWIGGGLFYLLVLRPATQGKGRDPWRQVSPSVGAAFAEVTQLSIFALTISGAILMVDRLTSSVASMPYVAVLALKIALSLWAFYIAWSLRAARRHVAVTDENPGTQQGSSRWWKRHVVEPFRPLAERLRGPNLIAVLGLVIVLLSDALKVIAESNLGYR